MKISAITVTDIVSMVLVLFFATPLVLVGVVVVVSELVEPEAEAETGPISDIFSFGVCSNLKSLNISKNSIDSPGNELVKGDLCKTVVKLDLS
ncbi:hypothetical protein CQW23_19149 [Capsicum baccatum]|uniref:Uncharacterized protein n=1 Tax=Capsicum baccatum TaxID=33114 RepID=A0A2G2W4Y9_CAPBA|nr:hypothetical protein CQW23_19149 [Capsicum baccatum]